MITVDLGGGLAIECPLNAYFEIKLSFLPFRIIPNRQFFNLKFTPFDSDSETF